MRRVITIKFALDKSQKISAASKRPKIRCHSDLSVGTVGVIHAVKLYPRTKPFSVDDLQWLKISFQELEPLASSRLYLDCPIFSSNLDICFQL